VSEFSCSVVAINAHVTYLVQSEHSGELVTSTTTSSNGVLLSCSVVLVQCSEFFSFKLGIDCNFHSFNYVLNFKRVTKSTR